MMKGYAMKDIHSVWFCALKSLNSVVKSNGRGTLTDAQVVGRLKQILNKVDQQINEIESKDLGTWE